MNCGEAARYLPGYLDGTIQPRHRAGLRQHLFSCGDCRQQLDRYALMANCLAHLDPVLPPRDLALRIRVQASQLNSHWLGNCWTRARLCFKNILEPLAVPATGGLLTALAVFVLVVQNILVGVPMGGVVPNDLPLNLVQPARLESLAPFPIAGIVADGRPDSGALVLEATLDARGQVVRYRILSGPDDTAVQKQIDQLLLFSRFRPELSFGVPMAGGRVLLSFDEVQVRG
jgi:putative zinc finger protein